MLGIDISPAMLAQARERADRGGRGSGAAGGRHARARAGRAGGADLLPVSRAAALADVGRPAAGVRAGRGLAAAGRALRLERVRRSTRTSPRPIDGVWADQAGSGTGSTTCRRTTGSTSRSSLVDSISLWWLNRSEWEGLIDVAGLEVEALYGWFDRRPFDESSEEFVWVARKPGVSLYDSIAELYDPWSRSVTEDVGFYVEEAGGPAARWSSSGSGPVASRCRPRRRGSG